MDNITFEVEAGGAVFIPPNTPHVYQADQQDPWSVFWIHFDGEQVAQLLENFGVSIGKPILYIHNLQVMRQAFEDVYACLNYNHSEAGLYAMSAEFMGLLSRIKLESSHALRDKRVKQDGISQSIQFMEKHLDMMLSLSDFAAQADLSVAHYSKLFRERTSLPPTTYFIQLKVRKACEQLYQTELSVQEIAEQLGYNDPCYFSRAFKKVQGVSPAKYRILARSG